MTTPVERQLAPPGGWHPAPGSRIAPLPEAGGPRLVAWGLGRFVRGDTPAIFLVLMRHWRLFRAWFPFAARLMPFGRLDRRDTELAILRVGWNCRCRYEWGHHVAIGLRVGLSPQQIARVAQGPAAQGWEPRQAALLQSVDELHRDRILQPATWQALAAHYDERRLLELCLLIGHYEMLAGTLNSLGLPLDASAEKSLAQAPIHE
ncbi:MAG: carboxymuconolactone decarboxylase family protein [Nevskia sp.]|nr:carboxymuconolactone decarboxylase family protein [Nevskia sp.]